MGDSLRSLEEIGTLLARCLEELRRTADAQTRIARALENLAYGTTSEDVEAVKRVLAEDLRTRPSPPGGSDAGRDLP